MGSAGSRSTSGATLMGCWAASSKAIVPPPGVAHQVGAIHAKVVKEPYSVLGLRGDGGRLRFDRAGAAPQPPPVVADALEALKRRFRHQRLQRVGDVRAVDEQHGATRPHHLIGQFDPVDLGVFHDCSSVWLVRQAIRDSGATSTVASLWCGHDPGCLNQRRSG
jgi:hypothetical protein